MKETQKKNQDPETFVSYHNQRHFYDPVSITDMSIVSFSATLFYMFTEFAHFRTPKMNSYLPHCLTNLECQSCCFLDHVFLQPGIERHNIENLPNVSKISFLSACKALNNIAEIASLGPGTNPLTHLSSKTGIVFHWRRQNNDSRALFPNAPSNDNSCN